MPLILDCYNVLHATMPPSLAGLDEAGLCRVLSRSRWAGEAVALVCDGLPKALRRIESPVSGVEIVYAGHGRSADDLIIAMIDADTAPRRLVVVSSDRQIQKAARRRRAIALSSDRFIATLAADGPLPRTGDAGGARPSDDKPDARHMDDDELARWLRTFDAE